MLDPYDPNLQMMEMARHMTAAEWEQFRAYEKEAAQGEPTSFREFAVVYVTAMALFALAWGAWIAIRSLGDFLLDHRIQSLAYAAFTALLLASAVSLFRLRCRHRLVYGLIEVTFGLASIFFAAQSLLESLTSRMPVELLNMQTSISVVAGLYIIIRGLANIEDALALGSAAAVQSRGRRLWIRTFHAAVWR